MFRNELPHLYELRDLLPDPVPPGAYFGNLDKSLAEIPQKLRQFRDIERDLDGLDPEAWLSLKSELKPLLAARHPTRGWQALFDKLNEAKAYDYLKNAGYGDVRFIPRSRTKGQPAGFECQPGESEGALRGEDYQSLAN